MSMCMYIARGCESQLRELADDPETLCRLGANTGGAFAAALGSDAAERLARMQEMLAQRPELRQTVSDLMTRFGVQQPGPSAAAAVPGS